jgi:preprotein translocase subunit SecA
VFNFIGNTIEVLSAPQRTVDELNRFVSILREAQQEQQSAEAIASRVQKDAPSFSKLIELLPKNRAELYGFVAVILAAAQLVTQPPQPSNTTVSVTVNQVIQQVFVQPPSPGDAALKAESKGRKVGRNEPCPCGSEKKYKKCCGAVK